MKISTGTLIFNSSMTLPKGMLLAQLRHLYSFADEIFITEGATKVTGDHYWDGDTTWATKDGHSTDDTLQIIESFPDPDNKITVIKKDGFWNGKTEMCNEWSKRATGDYLWQIDADEFYLEEDIKKIKWMLEKHEPDAVHFFANHFWGDFDHCINETTGGGWGNDIPWRRIFRHLPGAKWLSHEPPDYQLPDGKICNQCSVIPRQETLRAGIKMHHYSCVCKEQIDFKTKFFKNSIYLQLWKKWKENNNCRLLEGSRTVEFKEKHPIFVENIKYN